MKKSHKWLEAIEACCPYCGYVRVYADACDEGDCIKCFLCDKKFELGGREQTLVDGKRFTPNTVVRLECRGCGATEFVRLGDMPHTSQRNFFYPIVQCPNCLDVALMSVLEEDQE